MHLFTDINQKNKEKILYTLQAHSFTFLKNTNISNVIKDDDLVGFVESGYMQIIRHDYNGGITIIEELEENSFFGTTISSLNDEEYDILVKEDSKVIFIEYDKIITLQNKNFAAYNQFLCNFIEIITNKIIEKNERVLILSKRTIRDKLLEYFHIISKKNGSKIIYLPFTYMEFANYLAVDRSAMSRELRYLKEEGFIKIDNKKITLLY